jgi:hypothetical protein
MAAMITTVDNPIDPREDFAKWYAWDVQNGYNTCAYLARVAHLADDMPQAVIDHMIEAAINEIIEMHAGGMYKKLIVDEAA